MKETSCGTILKYVHVDAKTMTRMTVKNLGVLNHDWLSNVYKMSIKCHFWANRGLPYFFFLFTHKSHCIRKTVSRNMHLCFAWHDIIEGVFVNMTGCLFVEKTGGVFAKTTDNFIIWMTGNFEDLLTIIAICVKIIICVSLCAVPFLAGWQRRKKTIIAHLFNSIFVSNLFLTMLGRQIQTTRRTKWV